MTLQGVGSPAPKPDDKDRGTPFLSSERLILEPGQEISGWILGIDRIEGKSGDIEDAYFELLTEERGVTKLPISTSLRPLKIFTGKPVMVTIQCTGEVKTAAGSMKTFNAWIKRKEPFAGLLSDKTDSIPF